MAGHDILIVEDEAKIVEILKDYLQKAGFGVSCLDRGDTVVAYLRKSPASLMLLDIMIPGIDGMEVCREVRKFSNIPVIMITAKVEEIDRLLGLELGADDYICKPFSPREVVARIKAVLRRAHAPRDDDKPLVLGEIRVIQKAHQVQIKGRDLKLTPCEYDLLKILLSHPNRIYSRSELINTIQGYDFEGYDRTIDSHVKNLRKKLGKYLPGKELITTVYGLGYKWNSPPDE